MYQLGNSDTYINIKIFYISKIDTQIRIPICTQTYTNAHNKLYGLHRYKDYIYIQKDRHYAFPVPSLCPMLNHALGHLMYGYTLLVPMNERVLHKVKQEA